MTFLMILVEEYIDEKFEVPMRYYFGIDFDRVFSHPKDGSEGMMFCFVKNFDDCQKSFERNIKIDSLLDNIDLNSINNKIDNSYVVIYQTENYQEQVYSAISKKMKSLDAVIPWVPAAGIKRIGDI